MSLKLAIAGGGIGGLAAALACARAGCDVRVLEQSAAFSEAGAGLQVGPNVTRILDRWSLGDAVRRHAAQPDSLVVRDAGDGHELGRLSLGSDFASRYGAPYLTMHRADLQQVLLQAAREAGAALRVDSRVTGITQDETAHVTLACGAVIEADAVVAADGAWSTLREHVVADGPAQPTGHFAFRALALQSSLPQALRSTRVTLWLGARMHVVSYPVRSGEQLNVVALVEKASTPPSQGWDAVGVESDLEPVLRGACCELHQLVEAMPGWGVWALHDRTPMSGAHEMARGRVALLGDAAHPMLPYLAQGAGMAIEDADVLAAVLADANAPTVATAFGRYADARWRRSAQVQARARRNAKIFHASGAMRFARDAAMRIAGDKLMDQPWLYAR